MRSVVFGYDFPHRRSVEFLLRMCLAGFVPGLYLGAPWKELKLKRSKVRVDQEAVDPLRAADLCALLGVPYRSLDHGSSEALELIQSGGYDLGVIASARILSRPVIASLPGGILNLHAGLIPENRGLDHIQNAIHRDLPMGITAHLIDPRVDAGAIISRYLVPVFSSDGLVDLGRRHMEALNLALIPALQSIVAGEFVARSLGRDVGPANVPGAPEVDAFVERRWREYVSRWAIDLVGWRCVCRGTVESGRCSSCRKRYEPFGQLLRELD